MQPWRTINSTAAAFLLASAGAAFASEQTYYLNGQPISAAKYQACKLINHSSTLMRTNQTVGAVSDLKRALALEPESADAHSMLGIALARLGRVDEACGQFRMAIADNHDLIGARLNLATIYQ